MLIEILCEEEPNAVAEEAALVGREQADDAVVVAHDEQHVVAHRHELRLAREHVARVVRELVLGDDALPEE